MSNMKKRIALLVTAAAVAASTVTGCVTLKLDEDETAVTVGEDKVTMGTVNFFARYQQAMAAAQYGAYMGENMWEMKVADSETMEDSVKKSAVESLEKMYVLEDHMKDYNVELTAEDNKKIEKAAKDFLKANGDTEKEVVSADKETVERVLTLITVQEKMREAIIKDVNTEVSDDEAAQKSMQYVFFSFAKTSEDGTNSMMNDKEKAELKKEAEKFAENVKGEPYFDEYAKKAGYTAATQTFDKESTSPAAELVKVADTLNGGQCTGVIEADNGYYVAKVTSLFDREATDDKKASIAAKRQNDTFIKVTDGFVKETNIKEHKNRWEKISFKKQNVTVKQAEEEK